MLNDDTMLRSEDEVLADAADKSPEEQAFTKQMIASRNEFDGLIEPIISAMISAAQPDESQPMDDAAMSVMSGIQQALAAHLGKLTAVIGIGTDDGEGNNTLNEGVQSTLMGVVANVRATVDHLMALKEARESDNG